MQKRFYLKILFLVFSYLQFCCFKFKYMEGYDVTVGKTKSLLVSVIIMF